MMAIFAWVEELLRASWNRRDRKGQQAALLQSLGLFLSLLPCAGQPHRVASGRMNGGFTSGEISSP